MHIDSRKTTNTFWPIEKNLLAAIYILCLTIFTLGLTVYLTLRSRKRGKKYDGKEWLWASRLRKKNKKYIFHLKPNLINLHDSIIIFAIVNDSQNCRLWRHAVGIVSHRIGCFHCAWMLFNRWNSLLFIENYGLFRKLKATH